MELIQQLVDALSLTAVYLTIALGISIIYGLTRLVNFAQGQVLLLGSFLAYSLVRAGVPLVWCIVIATLGVAIIGEILDLVLFRRTLNSPLRGFVISLGLIIIIEQASVLIWGQNVIVVSTPFANHIFNVHGVLFSAPLLLLMATLIVLLAVLFFVFERTKVGRGTQALSENRATAQLMGIPVGRYISFSFLVGSGIAGLGGAIFALMYPFTAFSGTQYVLIAFAIAIIGGLGSITGCVVASLLLAIPQSLASAYVSISWAPAFGLIAAVLIILFRPNGIFKSAGTGGASHFSMGDFSDRLHASEVHLAAALKSSQARSIRRGVRRIGLERFGIWGGFVLIGLAPLIFQPGEALTTATYMVILAIAGVGFWLTFRQAGVFSVASGALMGVGGYTAAYLLDRFNVNFWLQLPAAIVAAGVVALIMGVIALRTSASYFVILTLMLSELIILLFTNVTSITGGSLGLEDSVPPNSLGPIRFGGADAFYYLAFGLLVLSTLVVFAVTKSRFGRRLISIRENAELARSLGVHVLKDKIAVFTLFGAISGVAGVMLFYYLHYITPSTYDVPLTLNIILIVLLGGATVWLGPIVGAAIFAFLPSLLNLSPVVAQLVYGVCLVAVIILMPTGVVGRFKSIYIWIRFRLRQTPSKDADSSGITITNPLGSIAATESSQAI
jgi:branched-subunit amino acid ABC-type transport system permease component